MAGAAFVHPAAASVLTVEVLFRDGFDPPPPAPSNDTCATAPTLIVGIPVNGTTTGASNDYDSGLETCTGYSQAGGDVAYSVLLAASTPYTITLSNLNNWVDASISLLGPGTASVCSASPVICLKGADNGFFGEPEVLQFTPSSSGTYYIIVDSFFSGPYSGGKFTIDVTQ